MRCGPTIWRGKWRAYNEQQTLAWGFPGPQMRGTRGTPGGVRTMDDKKKPDRGKLEIDTEECKGCGLCIEACPPRVIGMSERLNHFGYRTAVYAGAGCTGCGICFMVCPEPGAITVLRLRSSREVVALESHPFRSPGRTEKDGATASGGAIECANN